MMVFVFLLRAYTHSGNACKNGRNGPCPASRFFSEMSHTGTEDHTFPGIFSDSLMGTLLVMAEDGFSHIFGKDAAQAAQYMETMVEVMQAESMGF